MRVCTVYGLSYYLLSFFFLSFFFLKKKKIKFLYVCIYLFILIIGTTRDNFDNRPVSNLTYQSYTPLALQTLHKIATEIRTRHGLKGIAITHRLGVVPIGEESILIAVSSPHRAEAWRAGEECLEEVKAHAEIWKLEVFADDEEAVWRANRDGVMGQREALP